MPFRKVRFGEGEIFKLEITDCYGKTIEKWKSMFKDFPKVVKIINDKYDLGMIIKEKKDVSDLDWTKSF